MSYVFNSVGIPIEICSYINDFKLNMKKRQLLKDEQLYELYEMISECWFHNKDERKNIDKIPFYQYLCNEHIRLEYNCDEMDNNGYPYTFLYDTKRFSNKINVYN